MNELTLHPNVYSTGKSKGLIALLEKLWVREVKPGDGTFYIISGFANYNGGVRFYDVFRRHIDEGGKVVALLGGSTSQRLSSKQVVRELLEAGAEVHIVNRKRLMHAKSYGSVSSEGESLIVTSGNFTGPGMSQNVEMAVHLDRPTTHGFNFSWSDMMENMLGQKWDYHTPRIEKPGSPAWQLLYDEEAKDVVLDDTEEVTMIVKLGHADTARIMANPGTKAAKGTQYFWLSKDCFDFFPALTILNRRGYKSTYSTHINVDFVDLRGTGPNLVKRVRVTFEADNNLDFRFGTGPLRSTKLAAKNDLAAITRRGEDNYELRIFQAGSKHHKTLSSYAINYIGHQGKRYGFVNNVEFEEVIGLRTSHRLHAH